MNQPPNNPHPYEDQVPESDLETDGFAQQPVLSYGTSRKLNKKGLLFLGAIGALGFSLLAWGWSQFSFFGKPAPVKPKLEVVEIPADPAPAALPPAVKEPELPPLPPMPEQAVAAEPIAVMPPAAPSPAGPAAIDEPTGRRKGSSGLVLDGAGSEAPAAAFMVAKGSVAQLAQTDYLLTRGTYIRCVLETRIVSDLPGFASCIVTEPVYSMNGRKVLIPKGSKVSGQYKLESLDSGRVGVVWERVLTSDGLDIGLVSPGVDGLGASGHEGHVNRHWGSRITSAVLISLIGDAVQIAADRHAPSESRTTTTVYTDTGAVTQQTNPYQSQTAQTIQQLSKNALQEAANRPATVTINQGQLINIYASRDIDFSSVMP